jgi:hypothetical protein
MREIASPLDGFASPFGGGRLSLDPDAAAYIAAVQTADGAALERSVKVALNDFVLGCKSAGIWDAIKASCILAGARTLAGALVPLKGAAPTNFNFVSGDYDRKTGLKGDGATKYLLTGLRDTDTPQNSTHISMFVSALPTVSNTQTGFVYVGAGRNIDGGTALLHGIPTSLAGKNKDAAASFPAVHSPTRTVSANSFAGNTRSESGSFILRSQGGQTTVSRASVTATGRRFTVFGGGAPDGDPPFGITDARLSFYSIGESIDLAALDTRVSALMTAIDGALS